MGFGALIEIAEDDRLRHLVIRVKPDPRVLLQDASFLLIGAVAAVAAGVFWGGEGQVLGPLLVVASAVGFFWAAKVRMRRTGETRELRASAQTLFVTSGKALRQYSKQELEGFGFEHLEEGIGSNRRPAELRILARLKGQAAPALLLSFPTALPVEQRFAAAESVVWHLQEWFFPACSKPGPGAEPLLNRTTCQLPMELRPYVQGRRSIPWGAVFIADQTGLTSRGQSLMIASWCYAPVLVAAVLFHGELLKRHPGGIPPSGWALWFGAVALAALGVSLFLARLLGRWRLQREQQQAGTSRHGLYLFPDRVVVAGPKDSLLSGFSTFPRESVVGLVVASGIPGIVYRSADRKEQTFWLARAYEQLPDELLRTVERWQGAAWRREEGAEGATFH